MKLQEYLCPTHGRFESLVDGDPDTMPCSTCNTMSPWVISAPLTRTPVVTPDSRGYNPPPSGFMSTRELAEGMSTTEFKARRAEQREQQRKADVMEVKRFGL